MNSMIGLFYGVDMEYVIYGLVLVAALYIGRFVIMYILPVLVGLFLIGMFFK
jgi:hypothetical protein